MEEQVTVLGINRYSFKDDNGKLIEGCNVHYFADTPVNEEDKKGYQPSKATLPIEAFDTYKNLKFPFKSKARLQVDMSGRQPRIKVIEFKPEVKA